MLKTCEYLIFTASVGETSELKIGLSAKTAGEKTLRRDWVQTLGNSILEAWNVHGVMRRSEQNFFIHAIDAVQSKVEKLERGNSWFLDTPFREEFDEAWAKNQVLEIIHIIEIILILFETSDQLIRSDAVRAWFRFASNYGFFEKFEPVSASVEYFVNDGS